MTTPYTDLPQADAAANLFARAEGFLDCNELRAFPEDSRVSRVQEGDILLKAVKLCHLLDGAQHNIRTLQELRLSTRVIRRLNTLHKRADAIRSKVFMLADSAPQIAVMPIPLAHKTFLSISALQESVRDLCEQILSTQSAGDFESPSYNNIEFRQAGPMQTAIWPHLNDYRRFHPSAERHEAAIADFYTDGKHFCQTVLFNSGMSATKAVFELLFPRLKQGRHHMVVSNDLYFESKALLDIGMFGQHKYCHLSPNSPELLDDGVAAVMAASTANNTQMSTADLAPVAKALSNLQCPRPIDVVIDATIDSVNFEPKRLFGSNEIPAHLTLFVIRSLQKLEQNGMEFASGGCVTVISALQNSTLVTDRRDQLQRLRRFGTGPTGRLLQGMPLHDPAAIRRHIDPLNRNGRVIAREVVRGAVEGEFRSILAPNPCMIDATSHTLPFFYFNIDTEEWFSQIRTSIPLSIKDAFSRDPVLLTELYMCAFRYIACLQSVLLLEGASFGFNYPRISWVAENCLRLTAGTGTILESIRLVESFARMEVLNDVRFGATIVIGALAWIVWLDRAANSGELTAKDAEAGGLEIGGAASRCNTATSRFIRGLIESRVHRFCGRWRPDGWRGCSIWGEDWLRMHLGDGFLG